MGQDKALLMQGDRPLIASVVQAALTCTPEVWVMTPWPQRYRPWLPSTVRYPLEPPAVEPPGPLVALGQLWETVGADPAVDWLLVLACDLPGVKGSLLRTWQAQLAGLPNDAIAYLPHGPHGWEPLCGFYRRTCRHSLHRALARGTRSFQQWLRDQAVVAIPQVPPPVLTNCNTPADWASYQARQGGQS
jgi:molybdopterin-guanine dinucleotide biosynthesis protein A